MQQTAPHVPYPDRLRAAGLRVTSRRVAMLHDLDAHSHSSAEELYQRVAAQVPHLTRQAVYVSLNDFVSHGLVRSIELPGSPARYETRTGDNHHHLVCEQCGAIVDVDCAAGDAPCLTPSDNAGFEVHTADVTYFGICPQCRGTTSDATGTPESPEGRT